MKSIRIQILLFLILGVLIPVFAIGIITHTKLMELPSYANSQYTEIVAARSGEVSRELSGLVNQVQILSKIHYIQKMDKDSIKEHLPKLVLDQEHLNMTVSDAKGNAWRSTGMDIDISNQEQFIKIIHEGYDSVISQPFISPYIGPSMPIITISHAVDYLGERVGLVNIVVTIESLNEIVRKIAINQSETGWIINRDGTVIAHPDSAYPLTSHVNNLITTDTDILSTILQTPSGILRHKNDDGNPMITIYRNIENSPEWTFMITLSEDFLYSELYGVTRTILTTFLICFSFVIFFSLLYSKSIIKPILRLKETFQRATDGDLHIRADESIPNELGEASKSFNQMMDHIKELTFKDPITNLYNYQGFNLELPYKLANCPDKACVFGIVIISLDDFKRINSISGYEAGNIVLKELGNTLQKLIKESESVARYFGDEYILLLHEHTKESFESRVVSLWNSLKASIKTDNFEYFIKVSVGASMIQDSKNAHKTVNEATIAKLKAKEDGGNCFQFYNYEIDTEIKIEQRMEKAFMESITNNELYLLYQPIYEFSTHRIVSAEALLRWNHDIFGAVSPVRIIRIAEQRGLILEIGEWVLRQACMQCKTWQNDGYRAIVISVNISAIQLESPHFVKKVEQILDETGLSPEYLELEITETNAMHNVEKNLQTIKELKNLGIRISIDDFGTGYSSLAYFTRFPIDTLKIDRSFVQGINETQTEPIINTIILMAKSINVSVIAEGVETKEQLQYLKEKGCQKIQGYLISTPTDPKTIASMLY